MLWADVNHAVGQQKRGRMKLKNKKTGIIGELRFEPDKEYHFTVVTEDPADVMIYKKLAALYADWEDYDEPKKHKYVLPNKVRRAILSWVRVQDNPIEKISILRMSYFDTKEVDADGFYDYNFYGYVGDGNKNLVANTMTIRLKKPFKFDENKDYTLPELGIMGEFGGEE